MAISIFNEQDLEICLKKRKVVGFVWNICQREYPQHIARLAKKCKDYSADLTLVVAENSSEPYKREIDLPEYLKELNSRYLVKTVLSANYKLNQEEEEIIRKIKSLTEIMTIDVELYHSIMSSLLSRNLVTIESREIRRSQTKILQAYLKDFFLAKKTASEVLLSEEFDLAFIFNGRHSSNVGTKQIVSAKEIDTYYLERGFLHGQDRLFLQPFQTHDIEAMGNFFNTWAGKLSSEEKREAIHWGKTWAIEQSRNRELNPFLLNNKMQDYENSIIQQNVVPIFTSSIDERFSNLSDNLNGWVSQGFAIKAVILRLLELNIQSVLRIHPNALWKSWRELVELIEASSGTGIRIILPWDKISSYELIKGAPFVVTWGSTLSLESSAKGIPTVNLSQSRSDKIVKQSILNGTSLRHWDPKQLDAPVPDDSFLAIFLTRNYGLLLNRENWIDEVKKYPRLTLNRKALAIHAKNVCKALFFPMQSRPADFYFILQRVFGNTMCNVLLRMILISLVIHQRLLKQKRVLK
jgi:hypothetical protein